MKMRWLICALVLALWLPAGATAQNTATKAPGTGPVIEIAIMSHDFGEVYKQDKFIHAFTVKNVGTADLVIEAVKPG